MINAAELASMQAEQGKAADLTCVVSRYTKGAKDTTGGNSPETWTPDTGSASSVRIGNPKGEELHILSKELDVEKPTHEGTFTIGVTAPHPPPARQDKLICSDGHTYQVLALVDAPSYSTAVRLMLKKL